MFSLFDTAFSIELVWNIYLSYESFQVKLQSFIATFINIHVCNMFTIYSMYIWFIWLSRSMLDMPENMCILKLDLMLQKSFRYSISNK